MPAKGFSAFPQLVVIFVSLHTEYCTTFSLKRPLWRRSTNVSYASDLEKSTCGSSSCNKERPGQMSQRLFYLESQNI